MFAYCNNNPVNCVDPTGNIPVLVSFGAFAIGFVIGFVTEAMPSKEEHYNRNEHQSDVFEMGAEEIIDSSE